MRHTVVILTLMAGAFLVPSATRADEPDFRVARVSYVSGDVSYQRGDADGWNSLRVNTPLVTGDSFYAPEGGRAEVDLGSGTVVRLDGGTQVNLVNNTSGIAQLGMSSGYLDVRARSFPRGFTLEIDTPSAAVTILEPGRYGVSVANRVTTYSVVQGTMSLAVDGQQLDVREGESLEIEDTDPPTYGYGRIAASTPFQDWADGRDSRFERSPSARYVNSEVVGYEDLDEHGTWREDRTYGRVWAPSGMSQGWAPYQQGRWIWQDPYGWTWVSQEPWGWAPYHYGRWVFVSNYWCWVPPPPRGYRGPSINLNISTAYAPALVAFIGGRNWGVSIRIGGPAIGWVPLAPAERYYYPWQSAPRVTNNYTNITVNNAVTIVNYNTFTSGTVRPIQVDRTQIERAPVIGYTAVGVVPSRESLVVVPERNPGARAVPREPIDRPVVARLVPPPRPQQFAQKVAEIEKTGKPVARPVVIESAVGKPFVPGVRAPAGVRAFSAPAPEGRKELKARGSAEVRNPKKIERDIAPPTPAADRGRQRPDRPPVEPPYAKAPDEPKDRPDAQATATKKSERPPAPAEPVAERDRQQRERVPAEAPDTKARGKDPHKIPPGPARPENIRAPDTPSVAPLPPPVKPGATAAPKGPQARPEPKPPDTPEVEKATAPAKDQAKPANVAPDKKKAKAKGKGKKAPEPPPEPPPDPEKDTSNEGGT